MKVDSSVDSDDESLEKKDSSNRDCIGVFMDTSGASLTNMRDKAASTQLESSERELASQDLSLQGGKSSKSISIYKWPPRTTSLLAATTFPSKLTKKASAENARRDVFDVTAKKSNRYPIFTATNRFKITKPFHSKPIRVRTNLSTSDMIEEFPGL